MKLFQNQHPPARTWTFPDQRPTSVGPWTDEPDKVQWVDPKTGLDCLIVRNDFGALCGYVGLPPEHPLHGVHDRNMRRLVRTHGGLNFTGPCQEGAEDGPGVCHVPEPGRPANVWWFGFDCMRAGDLVPCDAVELRPPGILSRPAGILSESVYRDMAYVQGKVTELAAQLARVRRGLS